MVHMRSDLSRCHGLRKAERTGVVRKGWVALYMDGGRFSQDRLAHGGCWCSEFGPYKSYMYVGDEAFVISIMYNTRGLVPGNEPGNACRFLTHF